MIIYTLPGAFYRLTSNGRIDNRLDIFSSSYKISIDFGGKYSVCTVSYLRNVNAVLGDVAGAGRHVFYFSHDGGVTIFPELEGSIKYLKFLCEIISGNKLDRKIVAVYCLSDGVVLGSEVNPGSAIKWFSSSFGSLESLEEISGFPEYGYLCVASNGIGVAQVNHSYIGRAVLGEEIWRLDRHKIILGAGSTGFVQVGDEKVLLNLGFEEVGDDRVRQNNDIALVEIDTGRVIWERQFREVVWSLWCDSRFAYVSAEGSGYVLDIATGETIKELPEIFTQDSIRAMYYPDKKLDGCAIKTRLFSDGRHLYFFNISYMRSNGQDCRDFKIFDADTLECLRSDFLPTGYTLPMHGFDARFINGKVYLSLARSFWGNEGGGLLEIDPDSIYSDFVMDVDIQFEESIRKVGEEEEYVLSVSHPRLDDILRYGESAIKDLGLARSRSVISKKVKNPAFNGVLRLSIDGKILEHQADVAEKLKALKARIDKWGGEGYFASDGKTPVTFEWDISG